MERRTNRDRILELMVDAGNVGFTSIEIAEKLGIPRGTSSGELTMLYQLGYLKNENHKYRYVGYNPTRKRKHA